jgi:hypothetical protein
LNIALEGMCFCVDGCKIDVGFQNFDYPCLLICEKEQFLGPNLRERELRKVLGFFSFL